MQNKINRINANNLFKWIYMCLTNRPLLLYVQIKMMFHMVIFSRRG